MSIVQEHIFKLNAMKNSVEDVIREILLERKAEIVDLVKNKQLAVGKNSDGGALNWKHGSGVYRPITQAYATRDGARKSKPAGQSYNFEWTGQTFDNMGLKLTSKSYDIFTLAAKQRLLEDELGYGNIFELTEEHNDYVNKKIIEPELAKWISENWWKTVGQM